MIDLATMDRNIIRNISPNDQMFRNEPHYWAVGQSALQWINLSLQAAYKPPADVKRILDLPCGHGRVLRYLKSAFPQAEITACDLMRDGVDFCAATFGAIPIYSDVNPTKIPFGRDAFDLIWVGSLFTHLDVGLWRVFLKVFSSGLRSGGLLVFTTHGRYKYDQGYKRNSRTPILHKYERAGFGYTADSAISRGYGTSLSSPAWVFEEIAKLDEMRLVLFSERAWDKNQDVFACVRDPDWRVQHPPISTSTALKRLGSVSVARVSQWIVKKPSC